MPILDIAISTANNWANVQSILGRPGHAERVLWIETPSAARGGWSQHAEALLLSSGIQENLKASLATSEENNPEALHRWAMELDRELEGEEIHLHLNGGLKMHQIILVDVLGSRATLHYSDLGQHHTRPIGGHWNTRPTAMTPNFEALLYCYGFEVQPLKTRILDLDTLKEPFLTSQRKRSPQATEDALQSRWWAFRKSFLWAQRTSRAEGDPGRLAQWLMGTDAQNAFAGMRRELRPDFPEGKIQSEWRMFKEQCAWALDYCQTPSGSDHETPQQTQGILFEEATGAALELTRPHFPVDATGRNLCIHPIGNAIRRAEVDHAWLLPGGRVWVFECKAGQAERKDLEARIKVLKECFGSRVEFFLVGPAEGGALEKLQNHGSSIQVPVLALGSDPASFVQQLLDLRPEVRLPL